MVRAHTLAYGAYASGALSNKRREGWLASVSQKGFFSGSTLPNNTKYEQFQSAILSKFSNKLC